MPRPNTLRRPLIVGCLGAAFVMVGALGYQAVTAARAQKETVESVLRDYAELGAEQFARNVSVTLDYEWFFPVLGLISESEADVAPIDPELSVKGQRDSYRLGDLVVRFFWLDLERDALVTREIGRAVEADAAGSAATRSGAATSGAAASGEGNETLAATLRAHAAGYEDDWYHAMIYDAGPPRRIFVYREVVSDDGPASVYGFEGNAAALDGFFERSLDVYALLPEALTDGEDGTDLVRVRLLDADGRTLFENGPATDSSALASTAEVEARFGGLRVVAAIPPGAAGRLVVGGLPYSRLPLIVAMLVVTAALAGIGVALLRREQELVALREQFVAGASHELRTPLAQIRMFAETLRLQRVRSSEEERRSLDIIDRESRRLAFLVENLLQFSGASRRPQRFAPERTEIGRLAADVVEGFTPLAAARGATIELRAAAGAWALVDRDMLRQVLLNLLDNALKYGPDRQVVVVRVATTEASIELGVIDQGPGVAAADRPRVWERFWRGAAADGVTGTGIGLALVRELVELHGGEVGVEAAAHGGARFVVSLPRESAP